MGGDRNESESVLPVRAGVVAAGLNGTGLPDRMAGVNALLAAAPPPLRERVLVEFLGVLYTPRHPE